MSTSMREALEAADDFLAEIGIFDQNHVREKIRAALSSPAPDRLSEASAIKRDLEGAKVGLDALLAAVHAGDPKRELLVRIGDLMRDVKVASERADRLSRQPEAEPVAWIEFADNGNIRFWTSDPARAWTEGDNGRPLRKFTLAELVALAASPRLDRERLARTLYRRLVLNPPADFDDASADRQNEWLQLADAIMRETR